MTTTMSPTTGNRLEDVEHQTRTDSLVGSFFHSDATRGWQGCVVAEPAPGLYLVELFSWGAGNSTEQRLVPVTEMTGWCFYDTAAWMRNASRVVELRWRRERPPDDDDDVPPAGIDAADPGNGHDIGRCDTDGTTGDRPA